MKGQLPLVFRPFTMRVCMISNGSFQGSVIRATGKVRGIIRPSPYTRHRLEAVVPSSLLGHRAPGQ